MAKDYHKGYRLGQSDGASGNNKLASRSFGRLFSNPGSWLPGAENRDAEFRQGYRAGFEDKVRVRQTVSLSAGGFDSQGRGGFDDESRIERHTGRAGENGPAKAARTPAATPTDALREHVQSTTHHVLSGESSMSSATSFAHQVELLQQLKQYLSDFQERLLGVSQNYQRKVEAQHMAGMMEETYERFVERELAETQTLIQRLVDHIGAEDIPAIEREIAYLEQKLR